MDATTLAIQFITQGYVVVPNVVTGPELVGMQNAFEQMASRLGKRIFTCDEIVEMRELVNFIGHPGKMPVIEAFYDHFGHEPAIACIHLCRDGFDPSQPPYDSYEVMKNLHSDVTDVREAGFAYSTLNLSVAAFLWLDDTYPDAGSIVQVPGSHHLTYASADGYVVIPPLELVKQHCELDFVGARAGDVILQRGFNIHGVGPAPRHKRRQLRADYTPMALYNRLTIDGRSGLHQQFSLATRSMLPAERQRYFHDS